MYREKPPPPPFGGGGAKLAKTPEGVEKQFAADPITETAVQMSKL
jgi:hypothetical protein